MTGDVHTLGLLMDLSGVVVGFFLRVFVFRSVRGGKTVTRGQMSVILTVKRRSKVSVVSVVPGGVRPTLGVNCRSFRSFWATNVGQKCRLCRWFRPVVSSVARATFLLETVVFSVISVGSGDIW